MSYADYIAKILRRWALAVFYPYPSSFSVPLVAGAAAVLVTASWGPGDFATRVRVLPFGWWWFVIALAPVIGLVQVGSRRWPTATHRAADWAVRDRRLGHRGPPGTVAGAPHRPAGGGDHHDSGAHGLTRAQVATWHDGWMMWSNDLAVTIDNARAQNAVGAMIGEQGRTTEAAEHFREAVRIEPNFPEANRNLGVALAAQGKVPEAVAYLQTAIRYRPDFVEAHRDLGDALFALRRNAEALRAYADAVRLQRDSADGHMKYGFALAADGRPQEAVAELAEAVRLRPGAELPHLYLGMALGASGRFARRASSSRKCCGINPARCGDTWAGTWRLRRMSRAARRRVDT